MGIVVVMERRVFDKITEDVGRRQLYSLIAQVSASPVCQRFLFEQRFEDPDNCALIYQLLLLNPVLDPPLRSEMVQSVHPWGELEPELYEDGWVMLGNHGLWRTYPGDEEDEARLAKAVERFTGGVLKWGANSGEAIELLTRICPAALDEYGVCGWELFFDMAQGWSGDISELPAVVASLLGGNVAGTRGGALSIAQGR